jgi:hypothetical protein
MEGRGRKGEVNLNLYEDIDSLLWLWLCLHPGAAEVVGIYLIKTDYTLANAIEAQLEILSKYRYYYIKYRIGSFQVRS